MAGQLTLGLFKDIKPDHGKITVIAATLMPELPGLYPPVCTFGRDEKRRGHYL